MPSFDEQLDNEFKQLGFAYKGLHRFPKMDDVFTYFQHAETTATVIGEGTGKVTFAFAVVEPEKNKPFIEFIKTTIEMDILQQAGVLMKLEKRWRKGVQPFPSKGQMIREIQAGFALVAKKFENLNKVRETFGMDKRPVEHKEIAIQTKKHNRL